MAGSHPTNATTDFTDATVSVGNPAGEDITVFRYQNKSSDIHEVNGGSDLSVSDDLDDAWLVAPYEKVEMNLGEAWPGKAFTRVYIRSRNLNSGKGKISYE